MTRQAIVVFGAAVRADGRPSPALARRIAYAARAAEAWPDAPVLCSGASDGIGPSEASVMARVLLAQGVAPERLALDEVSRDTLQSVLAAAAFVRREGLAGCVVCSDRYHLPRIRLLLRLLGVPATPGPLASGRAGTRWRHWTRMRLREGLALPYDAAIVLTRRRRLLARIAADGAARGAGPRPPSC
jgi:uncharacterized SAM-binding protein YcdF (DUF218 family)